MKKIFFLLLLGIISISCQKQKKQIISPVNISTAHKDSLLRPLMMEFSKVDSFSLAVHDSTLFMYIPQAKLVLPDSNFNGIDFPLQYIKFIFPSEHTINGKHYDGEIQMYFKNDTQWVAVAFFIEPGEENLNYKLIINNLPKYDTTTVIDTNGFYGRDLLPWGVNYWLYTGTFTDKPQKLVWYIMKTSVTLSKQQISQLKNISTHTPKNTHSIQIEIKEF